MPREVVYHLTPEGNKLWQMHNPLADQVCNCFRDLKQYFSGDASLHVNTSTFVTNPQSLLISGASSLPELASTFYDQLAAPILTKYEYLQTELLGFFNHLRRFFFPRILAHWENAIRERTRAWRAFNKLLLEGLKIQLQEIGAEQQEVNDKLDAMMAYMEKDAFALWQNGINEILLSLKDIEKRIDVRSDAILVAQQNYYHQMIEMLRYSNEKIDEMREIVQSRDAYVKEARFIHRVSKVSRDIDIIIDGLKVVEQSKHLPPAQQFLDDNNDVLQSVLEQIVSLQNYKKLHDSLSELRDSFRVLAPLIHLMNDNHQTGGNKIGIVIINHVSTLISTIDRVANPELKEFATKVGIRWLKYLGEARSYLKKWSENLDQRMLDKAIERISTVLSIAPRDMNEQIRQTAQRIELNTLAHGVNTLRRRMQDGYNSNEDGNPNLVLLEKCAKALFRLNEIKRRLVKEHNQWQKVYDQLQFVESGAGISVQNLKLIWPELREDVTVLCQNSQEWWAQSMIETARELSGAINSESQSIISMTFGKLNSDVSKRFTKFDQQLLSFCEILIDLASSLRPLTENGND